jgi:electron transfer flavoprotein alpha subunit
MILVSFTAKAYAVITQSGTKRKLKSHLSSSTTDSYLPSSLVAVALEAGFASNVVGLPLHISLSSKKRNFQIKHSTQLKSTLRWKVSDLLKLLCL